jgi:hypothetical protein
MINRVIVRCEFVIDDTLADDTAVLNCDQIDAITTAWFIVRSRQELSEEQQQAVKKEARNQLKRLQ